MEAKPYLDYLDKEMTIMGILSAFSIAAPAAVLGTLLSKDSGVSAQIWAGQQAFIAAGSALCAVAAFLFYKQRSLLAWYYGQLSLTEALGGQVIAVYEEVKEYLLMADSWQTWLSYCLGFTLLGAGFIEYLLAIFFLLAPAHLGWVHQHLHTLKVFCSVACPITVLVTGLVQSYVRISYSFHPHAWKDFMADIVRKFRGEHPGKRRTISDT
jgi:hypothetical protein